MTRLPERHRFETKLAETWDPSEWGAVNVLVAVSGGPDSVALLRGLDSLKTAGSDHLVVAHFNHRLRGAESDADQAFVAETAARLGVPLEVGYPASGPIRSGRGDGFEAAARRARYQFFTATAAKVGARYVAVAHTADDQAETILHRILRGTGIGGLGGMRRVRPLCEAATLIRPLLSFRRAEVRAYLEDIGQPYQLDATNLDVRRTRNRIRHRLLPELAAEFNPDVTAALLRLGGLAGEVQSVVAGIVEQQIDRRLVESTPSVAYLDMSRWPDEPRYVLRELLMAVWRRQGWPRRPMSFEHWDILAAMAESSAQDPAGPSLRRSFPGGVVAESVSGALRLRRAR